MKKCCFILFCCVLSSVFAQSNDEIHNRIVEVEMKSASRIINFQANANTQNYDLTYSKLEFTIDPSVYAIAGKVTSTLTALSKMSTVSFDLSNQLTVSSVKTGATSLSFTQNAENELVITLPITLEIGNSATIEITYSGVPPVNGFAAFEAGTHSGTPVLWTLSEPFGASDWWPCKQDLNDKINSIDVFITAPSQYVSVSNGVEPEMPVINGALKTTHFRHNYPIPAYLIAIAVTNYQIFTQTAGTAPTTFPIVNYIYPENYSLAVTSLAQTLPIMNFFERFFEPYPFRDEKYGHAQFGWGGGMEHTTVSFMGSFNRGLIAHELAHQWFGDKITCGTWKDIWLNEGFATYLSSLVIENLDGQAAFNADKANKINSITSISNGAVYLTDAETTDVNRIFSGRLSYNKGAMVLNMLRFKMGDTQFFQALKNYLADTNLAYKYAVTSDLQTHLETVYGSSLQEFFNDWIYNQGYPTYTIAFQNNYNGTVSMIVNQTQSDPSVSFFEMPVPIRVFGAGGEQMDLVLNNTTNGETFVRNVPFVVSNVVFDPNKDLITKNSVVTLSTDNPKLEKVSLYPNPSKDKIILQLPDGITVQKTLFYNSLGQKVKETTLATSWDVNALSEGVYHITVFSNEGTKQIQFVKK